MVDINELRIGDYIRTKSVGTRVARIAKVTTINNVRYTASSAKARGDESKCGTYRIVISGTYELEDIVDHSTDIFDLIEVGDYVNGHLVIAINKNLIELTIENSAYGCGFEELNGNTDIKTVLTHEQFEKNIYEVD